MVTDAINFADEKQALEFGGRWSQLPSEMGFQTGVMPIDEVRAKFGEISVPPRPKKTQPQNQPGLSEETAAWDAASEEAWKSIDD